MDNRFVQIISATNSEGHVHALYALDAQGNIWWGPVQPGRQLSIEWSRRALGSRLGTRNLSPLRGEARGAAGSAAALKRV